jgi:hypothetical protein
LRKFLHIQTHTQFNTMLMRTIYVPEDVGKCSVKATTVDNMK